MAEHTKETIQFVDQSLRDGQQSLWGLRMRPSDMMPVAERLDSMPLHAVDVGAWPGLVLMAKRFQIDPWSMLDGLATAMPNQTLRAVSRSNGIGDFKATPERVLHASVRAFIKHRVTSFWILDVLYDLEAMQQLVEVVAREGGTPVPSIMYGETPHHTDEFFVQAVRRMSRWEGVENIYVEDASGVLRPDRARRLIPALVEAAGAAKLELHCHNTLGLAPENYLIAAEAGVRIFHTSIGALADGFSLPDLRQTVRNLRRAGFSVADPTPELEEIEDHLAATALENGHSPEGGIPRYDIRAFDHQLPGGMTSTLLHQLREYGAEHRFDELVDEIARVRVDMGYPIMATPVSQIVGGQALSNLFTPTRYQVLLDSVVEYVQGRQGKPLGPLSKQLVTRVEEESQKGPAMDTDTWTTDIDDDEEIVLRYFLKDHEREALAPDPITPRLRTRSGDSALHRAVRQVVQHPEITELSITTSHGQGVRAVRS
jgi:oxaloacetate decarboxylase (Na+ extruding) subunit alpha